MVEKSGVEMSGVGKFMVEKSGLEGLGLKLEVEKSGVQMSFNSSNKFQHQRSFLHYSTLLLYSLRHRHSIPEENKLSFQLILHPKDEYFYYQTTQEQKKKML